MAREFAGGKSSGRPGAARSGHPALRGVDSVRYRGLMLQKESGPGGGEVDQAWTEGAPRQAPPTSIAASLRTWFPVTGATAICLGIHWALSTTEAPAETRSYFVFLLSVPGVSLLLA